MHGGVRVEYSDPGMSKFLRERVCVCGTEGEGGTDGGGSPKTSSAASIISSSDP